jgi:hypothetical protein
MEIPGAMTGGLPQGNDEDRFRFTARKGERLVWTLQAASLGFPVDAWLRIENTNGVRVERSEGGNGRDPELNFTPGSDGTFQAVVGSLTHRGGSNHWYRLSVVRSGPELKTAVAENSFTFKPGTTNDLKVTVTRNNGYTNRVTLRAEGLPEGVAVGPVQAPEKSGEAILKVIVATNAPPAGQVFRILAATVGREDVEQSASFSFVSSSEDNGVPGGFRNLIVPATDLLWVTIKPAEKPAEKKPADAKK